MQFICYNEGRFGLLTPSGDGIIDLTRRLNLSTTNPVVEYLQSDADAEHYQDADPDIQVEDADRNPPIRNPGKVIAAPSNYARHIEEMSGSDISPVRYFLKAPSSIVGPGDTIVLPFTDRRADHEVELAFVMERDIKDIDRDNVLDAIFGFVILLDISIRGDEDRSNRKSYDTFTVIGPTIVTPDEIGDDGDLDLKLWVNDELRQNSNTGNMIYSCEEITEFASVSTTINAGDVITTGTPEGVGPLSGGDTVKAEIENIGTMTVAVEQRDLRYEDVKIHRQP